MAAHREKTWTTWLPNLTHAFVSARVDGADPVEVGVWLVDLASDGVERLPGFEAMGMRGSASGRLRLDGVRVAADALLVRRPVSEPDPRGPAPGAWFGIAIAATYLGVGEGARPEVARWALDRRPGDGTTAVADLPSVQLRLGRLDAELRAARIVVLDVARRWDAAAVAGDRAGMDAAAADVALAKWSPRARPSPPPTKRSGSPAVRASSPAASSARSVTPGPGSSTRPRGCGPDRVRAGRPRSGTRLVMGAESGRRSPNRRPRRSTTAPAT